MLLEACESKTAKHSQARKENNSKLFDKHTDQKGRNKDEEKHSRSRAVCTSLHIKVSAGGASKKSSIGFNGAWLSTACQRLGTRIIW